MTPDPIRDIARCQYIDAKTDINKHLIFRIRLQNVPTSLQTSQTPSGGFKALPIRGDEGERQQREQLSTFENAVEKHEIYASNY